MASGFSFIDQTSNVRFATYGLTSTPIGGAILIGPNYFDYFPGASYFANGSYNSYIGSSAGLVNNVGLGTSTGSASVGTTVTDATSVVQLATKGVTGTFNYSFLYPETWGLYVYSDVCSAPVYYETQFSFYKGILYGINMVAKSQIIAPGYTGNITTIGTIYDASTTQGLTVNDLTSSVQVTAGLTINVSVFNVYDCYFYSGPSVEVLCQKFTYHFIQGLLDSVTEENSDAAYLI